MRLLAINERVAADVQFLSTLPSRAHVNEFCKQAVEALGSGMQKSVVKQAAAALSVDSDAVSSCIMALSLIFLESAKVRAGLCAHACAPPHPLSPLPLHPL